MRKLRGFLTNLIILGSIAGGIYFWMQWRQEQLIKNNPEFYEIYTEIPEHISPLLIKSGTASYPPFSTFIEHVKYDDSSGRYMINSYVSSDDEFGNHEKRSYEAMARLVNGKAVIDVLEQPRKWY